LKFWVHAWWPVVVGILIVAAESTRFFGSDHTTGPLRAIWQALFGPVSDARWEYIHHLIRKSGHFIGYGSIGIAWLRAFWMTLPRSRFSSDAALALLGTAAIAICDEWDQAYLPNRTSSPWDVLLDCCGAVTMLLIVYLCARLFRPRRLAHPSSE
jgi:VanZ family protein